MDTNYLLSQNRVSERECQEKTHKKVVATRVTCVVIVCDAAEVEDVLAKAALINLAGVEEDASRLRLWLVDDSEAAELCDRLRHWSPVVQHVDQRNWNESWQSQWKPMAVGERFFLVPPGNPAVTPAGRIRLDMHVGNAFGNGDHPSTHLCLIAMERSLQPFDTFLDIGCGSGLLLQAAHALGARAAGCDTDAESVRPGAFIGSVNAVRNASCDFVAANIQLGVLMSLMPEIARVMKPRARGVLSGVLVEQVAQLCGAARESHLASVPGDVLGDWASVLLTAP